LKIQEKKLSPGFQTNPSGHPVPTSDWPCGLRPAATRPSAPIS